MCDIRQVVLDYVSPHSRICHLHFWTNCRCCEAEGQMIILNPVVNELQRPARTLVQGIETQVVFTKGFPKFCLAVFQLTLQNGILNFVLCKCRWKSMSSSNLGWKVRGCGANVGTSWGCHRCQCDQTALGVTCEVWSMEKGPPNLYKWFCVKYFITCATIKQSCTWRNHKNCQCLSCSESCCGNVRI